MAARGRAIQNSSRTLTRRKRTIGMSGQRKTMNSRAR
jgi:hypothetical protein